MSDIFKDGSVPFPDYDNEDTDNFTKKAEFTDDVFIYGNLYANVKSENIQFSETTSFANVNVENIFLGGGIVGSSGIFDCLTAKNKFDVGVAGTVFTAISETDGCNSVSSPGRVGIGSTQPDGRFQVGVGGETLDPKFPVNPFQSAFIITDDARTGIGTTQPDQKFQIGIGTDTLVFTGLGTLGIGTTNPGAFGINDAAYGSLKADFDGSIRIARNIYDSAGSVGANANFLSRDGDGIRWVSFTPVETEGVFIQDEGTFVPTVGAAQSFTVLNFVQKNSDGQGTDTLIPTAQDPNTVTGVATIFTQDLWGHQGTGVGAAIYRQSRVGINQPNPLYQLDVNGDLHASASVQFDSTLTVNGTVQLNNTLDVDGLTTFNETTDASSTTNASVQIDGGVGIVKRLIVGDQTLLQSQQQSTSTSSGSLVVSGGVGIDKNINIGGSGVIAGRLDVDNTDTSTSPSSGAVVIDGGLGVAENINSGGSGTFAGRLDVDDQTDSTSTGTGAVVVDGGVGIAKNLNVGQNVKVSGNLELDAQLTDFFNSNGVGVCKTDYRLSSFNVSGVGVGVSWRPSGVQTKRTLWVSKNGCDTNSGLLEGDAKYTVAAAAAIAQEGDTIKVRSGVYIENNPIGLRTDVAITGEDLRLVTIVPNNTNRDVFHVRRGCLIENLSFAGATITTNHPRCGAVAFPPIQASVNSGLDFQAVSGFTPLGPANEGAAGRWRSPYVRNCTNFMTGSIGMKINGDHADAAFTGTNDGGQDLKSMVCDSFTQYNEAGIGVSISNNGYAQLVSIFTIGCEIGIGVSSGGQCDLTNSNSSFGLKGLVADGFGDIEFTGTVLEETDAGVDTVISNNTKDSGNNIRIPFDGQGVYFELNMSNYPDSPSSSTVTAPLQVIRSIEVVNGGNDGDYSVGSPPIITLNESPQGPETILPEFSPNVSAAGTITSVDVINSGRNFLPTQNLQAEVSSGNATFRVKTDPILFTVSEATESAAVTGISSVTFNEFIPYQIFSSTPIKFVRLSRIITSSHSFEYIGAGTDINTSNPFQGGKPIPENEVIAINGGQIPFTSTDQKGNFRIGDGLTIDQTTSTIRGRDFNRAIQAQLTPLILALR
tara:strand:+ start:618 stop:3923 length:3306 start_codon:yes stop_codon:yes gene_type:complete